MSNQLLDRKDFIDYRRQRNERNIPRRRVKTMVFIKLSMYAV